MQQNNMLLKPIFSLSPDAQAQIKGSSEHPNIYGIANFYKTPQGVLVYTQVWGLPYPENKCLNSIFAYHIHDGFSCAGSAMKPPFMNSGSHYNPNNCPHPSHSGDMPPLFSNKGYALSVFLTDRFNINEIIAKTVIIHSAPDDFTTQPSGNSGNKIACGEIRKLR